MRTLERPGPAEGSRDAPVVVPGGFATPTGLERYRLLEPLGRGGMGVVYLAEDARSGRRVALKTVADDTDVPRSALSGMRQEIQALSIASHPGVVKLVDHGAAAGRPWYAMELLEGETFDAVLRRAWPAVVVASGSDTAQMRPGSPRKTAPTAAVRPTPAGRKPGDVDRLLRIVCRMCDALGYLHGLGIVHRDLKPSNVFVLDDDRPVLVDFGVATRERGGDQRERIAYYGDVVGTTDYMAPEQLLGRLADARADLYSLGCVLYEVVTGRVPFEGTSPGNVAYQHLNAPVVPPSSLVPDVAPKVERLILRLLHKRPAERLGYARDVSRALERAGFGVGAASGAGPSARVQTAPGSRAAGTRPDDAMPGQAVHNGGDSDVPRDDDATGVAPPDASYLFRPSFVGRRPTIEQLLAIAHRARNGVGQVIALSGDSGVGKTRLAAELATQASQLGYQVIASECSNMTGSTRSGVVGQPLQAFRPLLDAVADACLVRGRDETRRILGDGARVLANLYPLLGDLPGVGDVPEPSRVSAEGAQERVLAALRATIVAMCEREPLMLIIDDLQWADQLSLSLLASLTAGFLASKRLVIVVAHRSDALEFVEASLPGRHIHKVELLPLGDGEVASIVSAMLAAPAPPRALVTEVARQSGGNPFLVAEQVRAAIRTGILKRTDSGVWSLANARRVELPQDARTLLLQRLESLPADARAMAAAASVLGRVARADEVAALSELDQERALQATRALALAQVVELADAREIRFAHDQLRDAAYRGLSDERRRQLHRRATTVIANEPARWLELAHHHRVAGDAAAAVDYLERAGQHALDRAAYRDAARALARASGLATSGAAAVTPARLGGWERRLAEASWAIGEPERTGEYASRALQCLGRRSPSSGLGWTAVLLGQLARRLLRRSSGLASATAADAALAAARLSFHHYHGDRPVAVVATALLAVNYAERAEAAVDVSQTYSQLGYVAGLLRMRRTARRLFERARQDCPPASEAVCLYQEAALHIGEGDWSEARPAYQRAVELLRDAGDAHELERALSIAAHGEHSQGNVAEGLSYAEELFHSARERGNLMHETWGLYTMARGVLSCGDATRARALLDRALPQLREIRDRPSITIATGLLARACAELEDIGRARLALDELASERGQPSVFSTGHGYEAAAQAGVNLYSQTRDRADRRRARLALRRLRRYGLLFPVGRPSARRLARHLAAVG